MISILIYHLELNIYFKLFFHSLFFFKMRVYFSVSFTLKGKGNPKSIRKQKSQSSSCTHHLLFSPADHGVIRSDRVFDAMLATDRGLYSVDYPYADSPQSIGINSSHSLQTHLPLNMVKGIRVNALCVVLCFMSTDVCCDCVITCSYHRLQGDHQCTTHGE